MIFSLILLTIVWVIPKSYIPIYEQRTQSNFLKFIASLIVVLGHQTIFYCIIQILYHRNWGFRRPVCCIFSFYVWIWPSLWISKKKQKALHKLATHTYIQTYYTCNYSNDIIFSNKIFMRKKY